MTIDVSIHGVGVGTCSLSGKEGEGLTVSIKDGTLREGFLSQKAFMQLIRMKFAQQPKAVGSAREPSAVFNGEAS
jgi:hypothetical protein